MAKKNQDNESVHNEDEVTQTPESRLVKDFDTDAYYETVYADERVSGSKDEKGKEVAESTEKLRLKPNYGSAAIKCKIRAARQYNVPLDHLEASAKLLNGRKVDGYTVNQLLGRYGFYDGRQKNRADLARETKTTQAQIEFAEEKLKKIVKHANVEKAYMIYVNLITAESGRDIRESVQVGS